uniref:Basic tail secreted protein n=1 Tax=Rhipicephalus zambeziensis TaxID=60191 RepID=A0A224YCN6_9ACAR
MSLPLKVLCGLFAITLLQQMTISLPNGGEHNNRCGQTCHANRSDCPEGCACVNRNRSTTGVCVDNSFPEWNESGSELPEI